MVFDHGDSKRDNLYLPALHFAYLPWPRVYHNVFNLFVQIWIIYVSKCSAKLYIYLKLHDI
jgi:hypothetical protein